MTRRQFTVVLVLLIVAVAASLSALGYALTYSPPPSVPPSSVVPKAETALCSSLTTAEVYAEAVDGVFTGSGCYNVGTGLFLTQPVTIDGGTFEAQTTSTAKPIIRVENTSGVTIENADLNGTNTTGHLVYGANQAGIKLIQTTGVQLLDDNISNTGGDCLFVFLEPAFKAPNTGLLAQGGTYTGCGRDGISPSNVTASTFSDIDIVSKGQSGIDAESDIAGVGWGNVTITGCTIPGLVMSEALTGPVVFNNDSLSGRIKYTSSHPQSYPVTFNGGALAAGLKAAPAIIWQTNTGPHAPLTFNGTAFTRPNGGKAPLWNATKGAKLVFAGNGVLPAPLGMSDSHSTVTVTP